MTKSKSLVLIFIIGILFFIGGIFICVNVFDYSNKAETTAVITDFESYREYSCGKIEHTIKLI